MCIRRICRKHIINEMIKDIKSILIENLSKQLEDIHKKETEVIREQGRKLNRNMTFDEYRKFTSAFDEEEVELKEKIDSIEKATSLKELGLTFEEAIELLKNNKKDIILSEEDKNGFCEIKTKLKDKRGFVCVHKTNYIPTDNRIKTAKEANVILKSNIDINGEEQEIEYKNERNTIHFCMNGEVASHTYGNWDNCKYAVIKPLESINSKQIKGAIPVDLFVENGVELGNDTWILCPQNESETIKKSNPNVNVIEYEGENVTGYADTLLYYLGYAYLRGNNREWIDYETRAHNTDLLYNSLRKDNVPNLGIPHMETVFSKIEDTKCDMNIESAKIKILKEKNMLNTIEEINNEIGKHVCGTVLNSQDYDIYINEIIEYMEEKDLNIPESYRQILRSRNDIINMIENNDKESIEKFFYGLDKQKIDEELIISKFQSMVENIEISDTDYKKEKISEVKKIYDNFLSFSFYMGNAECRDIILRENTPSNICNIDNIDSIKQQLYNMMEKKEKSKIQYQDSARYTDGKHSMDFKMNHFKNENEGFSFSNYTSDMKPYYIISSEYKKYKQNKLGFHFYNKDTRYDIHYRSFEEPEFYMNGTEVLKERFFKLIPDSQERREFLNIYGMITYSNLHEMLDMCLESKQHEKQPIVQKAEEFGITNDEVSEAFRLLQNSITKENDRDKDLQDQSRG